MLQNKKANTENGMIFTLSNADNNSSYSHYSVKELKSLVEDVNIIFFPLRNRSDQARLKNLTLNQYARKVLIYLFSIRNIN